MMTLLQELYNKAKKLVADKYLSSPEGMREVQQMLEYLERENEVVNIGVQIMNLLPASSKSTNNLRWITAQKIAYQLRQLFGTTSEQQDALAAAIEKLSKSDTATDPLDLGDDDLPF